MILAPLTRINSVPIPNRRTTTNDNISPKIYARHLDYFRESWKRFSHSIIMILILEILSMYLPKLKDLSQIPIADLQGRRINLKCAKRTSDPKQITYL